MKNIFILYGLLTISLLLISIGNTMALGTPPIRVVPGFGNVMFDVYPESVPSQPYDKGARWKKVACFDFSKVCKTTNITEEYIREYVDKWTVTSSAGIDVGNVGKLIGIPGDWKITFSWEWSREHEDKTGHGITVTCPPRVHIDIFHKRYYQDHQRAVMKCALFRVGGFGGEAVPIGEWDEAPPLKWTRSWDEYKPIEQGLCKKCGVKKPEEP
jgi:hypothetical protein